MWPTLEDGFRTLDEASELAKAIDVPLTAEYLQRIARVEALPQNQSGADKSWVWRADRAYRALYSGARQTVRGL